MKKLLYVLLVMCMTTNVFALPPDESGEIMLVMYHGLTPGPPAEPYMRSVSDFRRDLELLYESGYRLITMADYLDNNINVPEGKSPVVFTFDDGYETAFSLVSKDGKLSVRPNTCVAIMNEFYEKHPDFGRAGVFYVCTSGNEPFKGAGTIKERFEYLTGLGFELGNHTGSHEGLGKVHSDEMVAKDMSEVETLVQDALPGYKMRTMAYPYGHIPNEAHKDAVLSGEYKGVKYDYDAAIRAAKHGKTSVTYSVDFDKYNVPRVRASNNAFGDLYYCVKHFKEGGGFISDGDPHTITLPSSFAPKLDFWKVTDKIVVFRD
ncbi:xylanase [Clostridia bacterium]|nr:xylanase [Clostridia bacterium]